MKITATQVGPVSPDARADQILYRLSEKVNGTRYIITSAVNAFGEGDETYVFAADKKGQVTDWGELEGSFKGDLDHERALRGFLEAHNAERETA